MAEKEADKIKQNPESEGKIKEAAEGDNPPKDVLTQSEVNALLYGISGENDPDGQEAYFEDLSIIDDQAD